MLNTVPRCAFQEPQERTYCGESISLMHLFRHNIKVRSSQLRCVETAFRIFLHAHERIHEKLKGTAKIVKES